MQIGTLKEDPLPRRVDTFPRQAAQVRAGTSREPACRRPDGRAARAAGAGAGAFSRLRLLPARWENDSAGPYR